MCKLVLKLLDTTIQSSLLDWYSYCIIFQNIFSKEKAINIEIIFHNPYLRSIISLYSNQYDLTLLNQRRNYS